MSDTNPLKIVLDNKSEPYFVGQAVTGRVILDLAEGIKTDGVRLDFHGEERVRWTEMRNGKINKHVKGANKDKMRETHRRTETLIDLHIYVIRAQGNQQLQLSPGHQEFPFSFQIPLGLPSSLETSSGHGHIRYELKARIEKSWWKIDPIYTIPVTVSGILDLNGYPEAQGPFQCEDSKYVCCCCCKDGPISFKLNLSKTGFVPGEVLNFVMDINNQSNKVISNVGIRLDRRLCFRAWGDRKYERDTVAVFIGPALGAHETKIWRSDPVKYVIPPIPPTNLGGEGKVIGLEYTLYAELEIPGAINLSGGTGILIGTIPFGKTSVAALAR